MPVASGQKTINLKDSRMNFSNKIVLVTGASRGIGRAIALEFAKRRARVAINYQSNRLAVGTLTS